MTCFSVLTYSAQQALHLSSQHQAVWDCSVCHEPPMNWIDHKAIDLSSIVKCVELQDDLHASWQDGVASGLSLPSS